MTLLISLYTSRGIIFSADSAITIDRRSGQHRLPKQEKFLRTSRLGLSGGLVGYFGLAQVGSVPMSDWLRQTLDRWNGSPRVSDLGEHLCAALNRDVPTHHRRRLPSGFHIGGFETRHGVAVPVFHYVWNYHDLDPRSGVYSGFGDYRCAEHFPQAQPKFEDVPASKVRRELREWEAREGLPFWFRNGELAFSAQVWHGLTWALSQVVRGQGGRFRLPDDLTRWELLADSLVRTNGRLFALVNQAGAPTIEGPYRKASIPWP